MGLTFLTLCNETLKETIRLIEWFQKEEQAARVYGGKNPTFSYLSAFFTETLPKYYANLASVMILYGG